MGDKCEELADLSSGIYRSRLSLPYDREASSFVSSLKEDEWIILEDIKGTEAHDIMLYENGILSGDELKAILGALEYLREGFIDGSLRVEGDYEDVHEFLENLVTSRIGLDVGGKLHAGRSRNDQVALDVRLKARSELVEVCRLLLDVMEAILNKAISESDTIIPLYTHTQQAQIGFFSHYLLAFFDAFSRDLERLINSYGHVNLNPLGASAVGGTRIPIDRRRTSELLGFDGLIENSLDAVSSRDFALEILSTLAILSDNLARISGDLILWSSSEFNFLSIPDSYASTSSVMPHKKNPCTLELIRARSSRVYGGLIQLLATLKGPPSGYNRDLQETKIPLIVGFETVKESLSVFKRVVSGIALNRDRLEETVKDSFVLAVDLAEALVTDYGLPFRKAHILVGHIVRHLIERGKKLADLDPRLIEEVSREVLGKPLIVEASKLKEILDPRAALKARKSIGAPSPEEVKRMINSRIRLLKDFKVKVEKIVKKLEDDDSRFRDTVKSYLRG
jgi:argininosuccinate lyase